MMNIKLSLSTKVKRVLINPILFAQLEQTGDLVYNYDDDNYLIFSKYKAFADSNVKSMEFKFDCEMEDIITGKFNKGGVSVIV
jgi:hypothetical protein